MIIGKKDIIDKPRWRAIQSSGTVLNASLTTGQVCACDVRGRNHADPYKYVFSSTAIVYRYNPINDGWIDTISPAMLGTFGRGNRAEFVPSQGPKGTIAAGASTTKIILTTALPASVGVNQLANRGDGLGYIVRVIGNAGGSSGKIEERRVVANTSGTTPTIYLDQPLSFTPANGDAYEFLSGRVFYLTTGAATASMWKYYDVLTGSMSGALSVTNLPTVSATRNEITPLDEAFVPYSRVPGEGFVVGASTYDIAATVEDQTKKCLLATGSAAGTLTGQAAAGDANVLANEYRNFQIRIVEDTAIPTAVGQRRRITSHTAGTSPVYTLASNWSVTPSTTCKFVIENDNDKLILFNGGSTVIYNYNHTANTWDTATWAARAVAMTDGFAYQQFGIDVEGNRASGVDPDKNQRNSFILSPRGNSTATYDVFDIAGAATGSWSNGNTFPEILGSNTLVSSTTGNQWTYDPIANQGRYIYVFQPNQGTSYLSPILRVDMYTRKWIPYSALPTGVGSITAGTSSIWGNRAMFYMVYDKNNPLTFVAFGKTGSSTAEWYELMVI
jgi:hypothetical protein